MEQKVVFTILGYPYLFSKTFSLSVAIVASAGGCAFGSDPSHPATTVDTSARPFDVFGCRAYNVLAGTFFAALLDSGSREGEP